MDADRPFRIRFELERPAAAPPGSAGPELRFHLAVRRNEGAWEQVLARDFPYPDEISTPRVSIVDAATAPHGGATGDLLEGSEAPFAGGSAVTLDSVTAAGSVETVAVGPVQTEWEWAVVIRLYADGAVSNAAGDTFEFRMMDGEGRPVARRRDGPLAVQLRVQRPFESPPVSE